MNTMGDNPDDHNAKGRHVHLPWVPSTRTSANVFLAIAELTGITRQWSERGIHHTPSPNVGDGESSSVHITTSFVAPSRTDTTMSLRGSTSDVAPKGDAPSSSIDHNGSYGVPTCRDAPISSIDQTTSKRIPPGANASCDKTAHDTPDGSDAVATSHRRRVPHSDDHRDDVVAMSAQQPGMTVNVFHIVNSEGIQVTQEQIKSKDASRSSQLKWMSDTNRSTKLKRITDRTHQLLHLAEKELFTPTKALTITKRLLLDLGAVLVTGRSGDGKTALCYRLLKDIANNQGRIPLIITTSDEWKSIPPPRDTQHISEDEKYVVFIDDVFGRTNLSREDLRMWERELPIMWPSVESGQVMLLLASRGNIYKQCQLGLKSHKLFSALKEVGLNTDRYGLSVKEKMEMLQAYLNGRAALKLTYEEIRQAAETSNELGFPQICRFYISSREAQKRGVAFFSRPLQYLMDELHTLRDFDPQAYGVLLLLAFEEGVIKQSHLDPFVSKSGPLIKKWKLIRSLCNGSPESGLGDLCTVAKRLCGVYLCFIEGCYRFSHQSIHETIVLEFTSKYPGKGIEIAPLNVILDFVRTDECEDKTAICIVLSEDYYKDLAVRIIKELCSRNSEKIMDHSALRNDTFLQFISNALTEDDRQTLLSTTVPSTYTDIGSYSVFSNDYITANYHDKLKYVNTDIQTMPLPVPQLYVTSILFIKGLHSLATILTQSSVQGCAMDRSTFLASSAFVGDLNTVERLLSIGIVPSVSCVMAALVSLGDNEQVVKKLLCHPQAPLLHTDLLLFSLKLSVHCHKVNTLKVVMGSIVNHQEKEKMLDIVAKLFFVLMSAVQGSVPLHLPSTVANQDYHTPPVDIFHVLVAAGAAIDFAKILIFISQTTDIELLESIIFEIRKRRKKSIQYQQSPATHNDLETDCSVPPGLTICPEFHLKTLINSKDKYGCTPLHNAAYESSAEFVLFLLEHGADPNSLTVTHETPLHEALRSKKDRLTKMQCLLAAGANVNAVDIGGCTPLHYLALKGKLEEFQTILNKGANMKADSLGQTPLHRAASAFTINDTVIHLLVEKIDDINCVDCYGFTPLIYIAGKGSYATLKHAIEKGADVNVKTKMGKTALHESVLSTTESVRKAELLLEYDSNINATNEEGFSPLLCAAHQGSFDSLKLLVDKQCDISVKNKKGQTALHLISHYSIDEGKKIRYLIEAGADINAVDVMGATALHAAAGNGCLASVETLVKYKCDINARDNEGLTALHKAAQSLRDSEAIIELLIVRGADVNMRDNSGFTPLCHAAGDGTLNSLQTLVANKADVFVRSSAGETVLHMAVKKYHVSSEKVEFLVNRGANVHLLDSSGTSPLHYAALETSYKTVKFLVENGANVQCANDSGTTPLHNAVASTMDSKRKVEFLIKNGADAFAEDRNGDTPLHVAADSGFGQLQQLLVDLNVDISNTDKQGNTLLYRAAMSSRGIISKTILLLDKGADINAPGKRGWKLIHWVISLGSVEDLEGVIERGAHVSDIDEDGSSLLHKAVRSKTDALAKVQLLMINGLATNVLDGNGCTPLHTAAKEGLFQVMKFLQENGCDTSARNSEGRTALHEAVVSKIDTHMKVVSLVEGGVDVNVVDNNNRTPLLDLAGQGPFETLEYLINRGADVTAVDNLGKTPLHLVVGSGLTDVRKVGLLIDQGCSVNAKDSEGHTPMHYASVAGDADCMGYLVQRGGAGPAE